MADKLSQIKTKLRLRLGEVTAGTWGTTSYSDESNVDELAVLINEGERRVVEDCFTADRALIVGRKKMVVESGLYQYGLPADFLSVIQLQHYHASTYHSLTPQPVRMMLDGFNPDTHTGSNYQHYDVESVTAVILDEGTITNGTGSGTVFQNVNTNQMTALGIRNDVDVVRNITDGSSATITSIDSTTQGTAGAGLTGGNSNRFRYGDRYQIETGEETRQVLWAYPPVLAENTEEVVSEQTLLFFQIPTGKVLYSASVKLAEVPATVGPITVRVETSTHPIGALGTASGTLITALTNPESAATIDTPVVGYNEAIFEYGVKMYNGTTYWVRVLDRGGVEVVPTHIKLLGFSGDEFLELHYARYPKPLVNNTDFSEMPMHSYGAVLAKAEELAYNKALGGRNPKSADARAEYGLEIEKLKRFMRLQNRQQLGLVRDAWYSPASSTHKNVPGNVALPLG